ncbi:hypothetical protein HU200_034547 [Digitaria exilis]|uniref:Protein kinase domain-containing protein n=1 Tax=Digitaria exilis TaxID=1010633 RepID=A0A835EMK2_9POAL|nr:hypothetical protein HU200_034547 [Digitaria exilis]
MWPVLGNAATVVQLAGVDPLGLIKMIRQAARMAHQNKADCEHLARRTDELTELLAALRRRGPAEPEAARTVAALGETLVEAYSLVVSCQGHGFAYNLLTARGKSEKFKGVEKKLDACLRNFPVVSHLVLNRRLDGLEESRRDREDTTTTTTTTAMAAVAQAQEVEVFTLAEITVATNNLAVVLAAGDSGTVYKGKLHDGREVAVKRRRRGAADASFDTELAILSPLRHGNIVRLVGRCAEDGELIVVTQLMTNGSLHDHLHRRPTSPVTSSWKARVEVLLGAARGIEYLHRQAMPALVIHGGVTSSHILLGAAADVTLTGFAASVWRAAGVESQPASGIAAGEHNGYADPELVSTGSIKPASDVYSLGVVMVEVLTGKPPVMAFWEDERRRSTTAPMTVVSFALPSIQAGRLVDVLDRLPVAAWQLEPLEMVATMAVRCLCLHGDNRPGISEVVVNLQRALDLICTRDQY